MPADEEGGFAVEGYGGVGGEVGAVEGECGAVAPVVEVALDGGAVGEGGDVVLGEALGEEELDGGLLGAGLAEGVVFEVVSIGWFIWFGDGGAY